MSGRNNNDLQRAWSSATASPQRELGRRKLQIMQTLGDHPLLSRRQIELACQTSERKTQKHLAFLQQHGWINQYNAHQPWLYTRALYVLAEAGNEILDEQGRTSTSNPMVRIAHLILRMERVFKTRNLFLWLANAPPASDWRLLRWDVEVEYPFIVKDKEMHIPFHGAAQFIRPNGRWITALVEFDTRRTPMANHRDRLHSFVEAQNDPRFAYSRKEEFPTLIVIAADALRLQEYYSLLRARALARQLPLPSAYLAVAAEAIQMREDPTAPIWYSTSLGRRTSLLFDAAGNATACPTSPDWQGLAQGSKTRNGGVMKIEPLSQEGNVGTGLVHLAALALALRPQDKQLLDEVARHPLQTARELATVLQSAVWYVEARLKQLARWKLIEVYALTAAKHLAKIDANSLSSTSGSSNQSALYLLGAVGTRYLAAVAGFDGRVRRYARARGWGKGLDVLLQYYEHTRQENAVFLQFAHIARRRKHSLTWFSELESRLYYELNEHRHSFLPDGRGTYVAGERHYEFTVEIDRSRASRKKLRRKMSEYISCLMSNVLRGERVEQLHILFVTQSWERAETVRETVLALAQEQQAEQVLKLYITTFDRLQASGADAAIWLPVRSELLRRLGTVLPKTYCFDCFKPSPA